MPAHADELRYGGILTIGVAIVYQMGGSFFDVASGVISRRNSLGAGST